MQARYLLDPKAHLSEKDYQAVLGSVDLNDAAYTEDCVWMAGVVLRDIDGTWPLTKRSRKICLPVGEAVEVAWDYTVPDIEFEASSSSIH